MNDNEIEQEIQAKGLTAPRITPADIEANIASEHYFTAAQGYAKAMEDAAFSNGALNGEQLRQVPHVLSHITICVLITRNGTKLVGANEGPVSPENFDAEMGRQMARQKAIDQMWPMLGYELRTRISEGRTTIADRTGGAA